MKAGIIGCGNICASYLKNGRAFEHLQITKCTDRHPERAQAKADEFGIQAVPLDDLFTDPDIDIILNLTTPKSHTDIELRALENGKHVYSEKPLGLDLASGLKVMETAKRKGLHVGCAPDTFMGGGHQFGRMLLDDGMIGRVVAGNAFMLNHGHEHWHPAPGFYYQQGGGPLFDMGPYYITALINLLGPVKRVVGMSTRSSNTRIGRGVNAGKRFPVEIDTHVTAILEFACGAVVNLTTSFDIWQHSDLYYIELYGTQGALHFPDPNKFTGDVSLCQAGITNGWVIKENRIFIYNDNMRCIGLADMATGIETGRPYRCSGELACHVLDVMCGITRAAEEHVCVEMTTTCEKPAPMGRDLRYGQLD